MQNDVDDQLIDLILEGDRSAFESLVEKYKDMVYSIAYKIVLNHEMAQEVAQDAFVKCYRSLAGFKRESKFKTWLYRIVYNTAISYTRKKRMDKKDIEIVKYTYAEKDRDVLEQEDKRYWIEFCLKKMNVVDRSIINLYYFEEKNLEEVSQVTSIRADLVKVKLHRARKKLAALLKEHLKEESYLI